MVQGISLMLPGGAVVKNPPANAEDMSSIPGPRRFHMPRDSAGEYQADEPAGVARLSWRVSGR